MLWVLTGLGGDHRLYQRLRIKEPHRHITWDKEFAHCKTMMQFAQHCVDMGIKDGDQLMGSSFGGMVAAEISHLRQLNGCLLLGTALYQTEINRLSLIVGQWLKHFGGKELQQLSWPLGLGGPKALMVHMFQSADTKIMAHMLEAILSWSGQKPATFTERIHGRYDPVIPLRPHVRYDHIVRCSHPVAYEAPAICQQALNRLVHNTQKPPLSPNNGGFT